MEFEAINHRTGRKRYGIYTIEEANSRGLKYIADWRSAEQGDWIMTDGDPEPRVLKVLHRKGDIIRHCRGTFNVMQAAPITSEKRENRFSFGGKNSVKSVKGKKERDFATALVETMSMDSPAGNAMEAYKKLHPNVTDQSAKLLSGKQMNNPLVQSALKEIMTEGGLTEQSVITPLVKILSSEMRGQPRHSDVLKAVEISTKLLGMVDPSGQGDGKQKVLSFTREWIESATSTHRKETMRVEQ